MLDNNYSPVNVPDLDQVLLSVLGHPFTGDCCFLCAEPLKEDFTQEHVIPQWLQKKYQLHNQRITLLNGTDISYRQLTIPCCSRCNRIHLSQLENHIKKYFTKGILSDSQTDRHALYRWCAKIYIGLLYKELFLKANRERADSSKIGTHNSFDNLKILWLWLHTSFRQFQATDPPGSVFIFRCADLPTGMSFDLLDDCFSNCIALRIGTIGVIVDFLDHHVHYSECWHHLSEHRQQKLGHLQFRELSSQIFYKARLIHISTDVSFYAVPPDRRLIISFNPQFPDPSVFCQEWDNNVYARVLAGYTGISLSQLYDQDRKMVWTFLRDSSGQLTSESI